MKNKLLLLTALLGINFYTFGATPAVRQAARAAESKATLGAIRSVVAAETSASVAKTNTSTAKTYTPRTVDQESQSRAREDLGLSTKPSDDELVLAPEKPTTKKESPKDTEERESRPKRSERSENLVEETTPASTEGSWFTLPSFKFPSKAIEQFNKWLGIEGLPTAPEVPSEYGGLEVPANPISHTAPEIIISEEIPSALEKTNAVETTRFKSPTATTSQTGYSFTVSRGAILPNKTKNKNEKVDNDNSDKKIILYQSPPHRSPITQPSYQGPIKEVVTNTTPTPRVPDVPFVRPTPNTPFIVPTPKTQQPALPTNNSMITENPTARGISTVPVTVQPKITLPASIAEQSSTAITRFKQQPSTIANPAQPKAVPAQEFILDLTTFEGNKMAFENAQQDLKIFFAALPKDFKQIFEGFTVEKLQFNPKTGILHFVGKDALNNPALTTIELTKLEPQVAKQLKQTFDGMFALESAPLKPNKRELQIQPIEPIIEQPVLLLKPAEPFVEPQPQIKLPMPVRLIEQQQPTRLPEPIEPIVEQPLFVEPAPRPQPHIELPRPVRPPVDQSVRLPEPIELALLNEVGPSRIEQQSQLIKSADQPRVQQEGRVQELVLDLTRLENLQNTIGRLQELLQNTLETVRPHISLEELQELERSFQNRTFTEIRLNPANQLFEMYTQEGGRHVPEFTINTNLFNGQSRQTLADLFALERNAMSIRTAPLESPVVPMLTPSVEQRALLPTLEQELLRVHILPDQLTSVPAQRPRVIIDIEPQPHVDPISRQRPQALPAGNPMLRLQAGPQRGGVSRRRPTFDSLRRLPINHLPNGNTASLPLPTPTPPVVPNTPPRYARTPTHRNETPPVEPETVPPAPASDTPAAPDANAVPHNVPANQEGPRNQEALPEPTPTNSTPPSQNHHPSYEGNNMNPTIKKPVQGHASDPKEPIIKKNPNAQVMTGIQSAQAFTKPSNASEQDLNKKAQTNVVIVAGKAFEGPSKQPDDAPSVSTHKGATQISGGFGFSTPSTTTPSLPGSATTAVINTTKKSPPLNGTTK